MLEGVCEVAEERSWGIECVRTTITCHACSACTHRVQPLQRSRTSLVFEELPNEAALRSRSKAEGAAACSAAATASTADAKYARAAGALLSMGGAAGSRAEGRCVVM